MLTSELRASARRALQGKWGKGALITLCYLLIVMVIEFVLTFIPVIGPIAYAIISIPITFGLAASLIRLKRGEEVKYTGFLEDGFSKFGKTWGVYGHILLKMIVPIILIIVSAFFSIASSVAARLALNSSENIAIFGVLTLIALIIYVVCTIYACIKGLLYMLVYYILYDNPDMSSKEIVEQSERLMKGNRWKYIWLGLTFLGWMILAGFTFGIGFLWLIPYMEVATICFYEALAGKNQKQEIEVVEEEINPISE